MLRLQINSFFPAEADLKTRIGSKVTKKYDRAQTPYQRVMASPDISAEIKADLTRQYRQLNRAQLRRQILALSQLLELVKAKHQPAQLPVPPPTPAPRQPRIRSDSRAAPTPPPKPSPVRCRHRKSNERRSERARIIEIEWIGSTA